MKDHIKIQRFWTNFIIVSLFNALFTFLSFGSTAFQESQQTLTSPEPEKIYLQLDGNTYTSNETIWFKSIVSNASDHIPSKLSGVLYVELIGPTEKIIEKKIIKLKNGIGTGFFDLNQNYPSGNYLIRAYSEWDRNFGSDFIFKEYIQVFNSATKTDIEPINKISLIEGNIGNRHILANFDPKLIDSLHKKDLTVVVTKNTIKDTLTLESKDDNKYAIDLVIPDSCQFVTFKMITKNKFSYTKTFVIDEDHIDLQFFPESGEMVHGINSKVGFKALDYRGKGIMISGEIVNSESTVITKFSSNQLGMGTFVLSNPDKLEKYFARIRSKSDTSVTNLYPLPKAVSTGNVLSVSKRHNEFLLNAYSNYMLNDSIYIKVTSRGFIYYDVKGKLNNGELAFSLPETGLPDGIIALSLMDASNQMLAERLVFNENPRGRLRIEISSNKVSYNQREMTSLNINTLNFKLKPVKASLSLLVVNKDQLGSIQQHHQNILSYFLLSSDLRGEIENPGYYFSKANSEKDLDALLLTQGWRRYIYSKPFENYQYQPETSLNLSGSVGGTFLRSKKKAAEITLMTFGQRKTVQTQTTDTLGRFYFNLNDEYGQNINLLLQSSNNKGTKKDYTINLDKNESPKVLFDHTSAIGRVDSVVKKLVEQKVEQKKVDETYKLSGSILLNEVKIEAYRMTAERKKVMQKYGKPDEVINGEAIQAQEEKWSFGLYSVIQSKFPEILIHRYLGYNEPGFLWAQVRASIPTLVVIDGITVINVDYPLIPNIPVSAVKSFEIIKDVSNKSRVFQEFCPTCGPMDTPHTIDVIAIYTYNGEGIYGTFSSKGITKAAVPVFSTPREFYAPKYENLKPEDWYKPDLRTLIDWKPTLVSDSCGLTTTSYYNSDKTGNVEVIVEALSDNGEIGFKEIIYDVKKKK